MKDYSTSPQLKGVGIFVWLFGLVACERYLSRGDLDSGQQGELVQGRDMMKWEMRLVLHTSLASLVLLLLAIGVAIESSAISDPRERNPYFERLMKHLGAIAWIMA